MLEHFIPQLSEIQQDYGARLLDIGAEYDKRIDEINAAHKQLVGTLKRDRDEALGKVDALVGSAEAMKKKIVSQFDAAMMQIGAKRTSARLVAETDYVDASYKAKGKVRKQDNNPAQASSKQKPVRAYPLPKRDKNGHFIKLSENARAEDKASAKTALADCSQPSGGGMAPAIPTSSPAPSMDEIVAATRLDVKSEITLEWAKAKNAAAGSGDTEQTRKPLLEPEFDAAGCHLSVMAPVMNLKEPEDTPNKSKQYEFPVQPLLRDKFGRFLTPGQMRDLPTPIMPQRDKFGHFLKVKPPVGRQEPAGNVGLPPHDPSPSTFFDLSSGNVEVDGGSSVSDK